jgi:hypothetical protein
MVFRVRAKNVTIDVDIEDDVADMFISFTREDIPDIALILDRETIKDLAKALYYILDHWEEIKEAIEEAESE